MQTTAFLITASVLIGGVAAAIWAQGNQETRNEKEISKLSPKREDKVVKTDAEWKKLLTPDQYKILRHGSTEAPFCTPFHDNHKDGEYVCAGCRQVLFASKDKFDSGTGWPSFTGPATDKSIWKKVDKSLGMVREEVLCARCDGHLGHVFEDGPKPTGLRYCINGKAMLFHPKGTDKYEAP